jgi:hypothetical protein
LESRTVRSKEILPLCEQIDSFEIGFPELVVFRSAAFRIAEMEKQLNDTMMKIQVVNLVSESLSRERGEFRKEHSDSTRDRIESEVYDEFLSTD